MWSVDLLLDSDPNSVKALGAYDTYVNQHSTYMVVQVPALQKKRISYFDKTVYFSSELQLLTWFMG